MDESWHTKQSHSGKGVTKRSKNDYRELILAIQTEWNNTSPKSLRSLYNISISHNFWDPDYNHPYPGDDLIDFTNKLQNAYISHESELITKELASLGHNQLLEILLPARLLSQWAFGPEIITNISQTAAIAFIGSKETAIVNCMVQNLANYLAENWSVAKYVKVKLLQNNWYDPYFHENVIKAVAYVIVMGMYGASTRELGVGIAAPIAVNLLIDSFLRIVHMSRGDVTSIVDASASLVRVVLEAVEGGAEIINWVVTGLEKIFFWV